MHRDANSPTPTVAADPVTGIRLTRLGVALRGLIRALEAAAYEASDNSLLDPSSWSDLASKVPARFAACSALLDVARSARHPEHAERTRAMGECFDGLQRAYEDFRRRGSDRDAAAKDLLVAVRSTKAKAERWCQ